MSWTATGSAFADGYQVFSSTTAGGPYTLLATLAGQATVAYADLTPAFSTSYYYVLQATKNSWRSANSAQVAVTTLNNLCN